MEVVSVPHWKVGLTPKDRQLIKKNKIRNRKVEEKHRDKADRRFTFNRFMRPMVPPTLNSIVFDYLYDNFPQHRDNIIYIGFFVVIVSYAIVSYFLYLVCRLGTLVLHLSFIYFNGFLFVPVVVLIVWVMTAIRRIITFDERN